MRLSQSIGQGICLQVAALDGVLCDPHLRPTSPSFEPFGRCAAGGRGGLTEAWQAGPRPGHWGIGTWQLTRKEDAVDGAASQRNRGVYAVLQSLLREGERSAGRTTIFVRAGAANRNARHVSGDCRGVHGVGSGSEIELGRPGCLPMPCESRCRSPITSFNARVSLIVAKSLT